MSDGCHTCLYKHFDENGALLYVGISINLAARLAQHKAVSHWFLRIARVEIQHFESRKDAIAEERRLIKELNPECNILLKSKHLKPVREELRKPDLSDPMHLHDKVAIIERVTEYKPLYLLNEIPLPVSVAHLKREIDAGNLECVELPALRDGERPRLAVTGWQLINYLCHLESVATYKRSRPSETAPRPGASAFSWDPADCGPSTI